MVKNIPCKYCGGETAIRHLDTISVDNRPMTETEVNCKSCEARYVI
jgi:hypothetical protein